MIWHVCQAVSKAQKIDEVWVLTDSEEVFDAVSAFGENVLMTSEKWPSGTARIASMIDELKADYVVNVQGDEPLMSGKIVDDVVLRLEHGDADVVTPVVRITEYEDLIDTSINKVVRAADGRALYFSHSPIPHVRDEDIKNWLSFTPYWGHVGVYGFKRQVLEGYSQLHEGTLEVVEKLEQLRLLEAGKQIFTIEADHRPLSVDTAEDLEKVKEILSSDNGRSIK